MYKHTFLNYPQVTTNIFAIVNQIRKLLSEVNRLDEDIDAGVEVDHVNEQFDSAVNEFIKHVQNLNQVSSSQYPSQLLTRLNFNQYYDRQFNRMDMETIHSKI